MGADYGSIQLNLSFFTRSRGVFVVFSSRSFQPNKKSNSYEAPPPTSRLFASPLQKSAATMPRFRPNPKRVIFSPARLG
jgi:hypothetical protein